MFKRSEGLIGNAGGAEQFTIHTKAPVFQKGSLTKEKVLDSMRESLAMLKTNQMETFFLHSPDPDTPIEETLEAVQELYESRKFKRFGLSNFTAQDLEQIYSLCRKKGYVLPTVFQGNYSPVARHAEKDLIPLLRKLNIRFYVYSPLAGGFLAKSTEQFEAPIKGRWDPHSEVGKLYNHQYNKPHLVAALKQWGEAAEKAGCTRAALAYRWVMYHSVVSGKYGDGLIFGASKLEQIGQTLDCFRDGPLPKDVLPLIEEIWQNVQDEAPFDNYHG